MKYKTIIIDLHYLPCVEYFVPFLYTDKIQIEANDNFQKQSYRNRCYILTANRVERLTVPVLKANKGLPYREIEIDDKQKWQNQHWRALTTAYAKAPYFEIYADIFREVIYQDHQFVYELNLDLLTGCLKALGIPTKLSQTDSYHQEYTDDVLDLRGQLHPKRECGIVRAEEYIQVFHQSFVKNLSILDVVFCEGPNARNILKNTTLKYL
ncbi:WbqC family protein [Rapidithrix thailandica]|uniref:WbqC family protein n=1 Tax=Rapidithrix thailandica TaxID=413964 RepID=A0AAW9S1U3_9BACT